MMQNKLMGISLSHLNQVKFVLRSNLGKVQTQRSNLILQDMFFYAIYENNILQELNLDVMKSYQISNIVNL